MRWRQQFGIRAMVVLTVCGVVGAGVGMGSAGAAAAKPKAGGSNAVPSSTTEGPPFLAIYDGLLSPDSLKGVARPRIASMSSKDSTVWTMTLRPGVKFSDGTAFDANAVKTNWDRIKNKNPVSPARLNFDEVDSYVVTDPTTLTITLKNPNADFPYVLSTFAQNYIVSPQQLATNEASVARAPIGAGAYTVKEFVQNSSLSLVRNPNYYGKTYLDSITIGFVIDEAQRLATLRSGGADLMKTTDAGTASQAKQAGLTISNLNAAGGQAVMFNTTKAPFNDVRARQAIAYAFDTKALNGAVYTGAAETVSTLFPKGSQYYDASIMQLKTNDKKAQALFDQLAAEGKPVDFTLSSTNTPQYVGSGQWLQTKLAGFKNVTMKLAPLLSGSLTTVILQPGNFQAVLFPPKMVVAADFVQYFQTGSARNYGKYSNPTMDAAIRKATTAKDAAARVNAVKEVQELLVKEVPDYFYVRDPNFIVQNKTIKGHKPDAYSFNIPDWTKIWKVAP
jgi:peptide/nickel transport system substrate-binding protein